MKFIHLVLLNFIMVFGHALAQETSWKAPSRGRPAVDHSASASWWTLYQDPELNHLIDSVDVSSPQIAAALQRVEQARAKMNGARSALFPTLDAGLTNQFNRYSAAVDNSFPSRNANELSVGIVASYEIDLWGRIRNTVSSARSAMLAEKAIADSLRLSIRAEITDAYLMLRGNETELAVVNEVNYGRKIALDLTEKRTTAGNLSEFELEQVRADYASGLAEAASISQIRMELENLIALLAGKNATGYNIASTGRLPKLPAVPSIIPGELLRRRPDIAASHRRLDAAFSEIKVTEAGRYPTLKLEAGVGLTADEPTNLDRNEAQEGMIGLRLTFPLIDTGGRQEARVDEAKSKYGEEEQLQKQQILTAFAEAETALGKVHWSGQQSRLATQSSASATRAAELSMKRFESGNIDTFQFLQVSLSRLEASRKAVRARTAELRASVALIRALGGGWIDAKTNDAR